MTYKEGDEDKYKTFNTDVDYAVQPLLKIALDNGYKPTSSIVSSFISFDKRAKMTPVETVDWRSWFKEDKNVKETV